MPRPYGRAALATVTMLIMCLSAPSMSAVGGLAFVHTYQNGDMGIEGIGGPRFVAVSPDGISLYVASVSSEGPSIGVFRRDAETGRLSEVQVVPPVVCVGGVSVSPDGANVYVAGDSCDTLAVFQRDAMTGMLTLLEVQQQGVGGVDGLGRPLGVTVSPDGSNVYVAALAEGAVGVFARDSGTGALSFVEVQKNGMNGVSGLSGAVSTAVSPDGENVYVASRFDNAVTVFGRDALTGALTFLQMEQDGVGGVDGLQSAGPVIVTADGKHVYAAGPAEDAVAVFARDTGSGLLSFVEVQRDGVGGVPSQTMGGADSLDIRPDGSLLYVGAFTSESMSVFERDAVTGRLSFIEVHKSGSRGLAPGSLVPSNVMVSPDGRYLYAAPYLTLFQAVKITCPSAPQAGCRQPTASHAARLDLRRHSPADAGKVAVWRWAKGAATTLADFGTPLATTDYALCVYDASGAGQPVLRASVPADNVCHDEHACWVASPAGGPSYNDPARTPDGIRSLKLRPGADGQASIQARLSGSNIGVPVLPLTPPVRVQLLSSDGNCWDALYSTPAVNDTKRFRALAD